MKHGSPACHIARACKTSFGSLATRNRLCGYQWSVSCTAGVST